MFRRGYRHWCFECNRCLDHWRSLCHRRYPSTCGGNTQFFRLSGDQRADKAQGGWDFVNYVLSFPNRAAAVTFLFSKINESRNQRPLWRCAGLVGANLSATARPNAHAHVPMFNHRVGVTTPPTIRIQPHSVDTGRGGDKGACQPPFILLRQRGMPR